MEDYRVSEPEAVHALMGQLAQQSTLLNISAPDGSSYTTTLWGVDAAHRRIGFAADAGDPRLQSLIDAGEAVVVGHLDAVKVQFDLQGMWLVHGQRSCVLQADVPGEVFRFQRRSSFRVRTLPRSAPVVRLRHPSLPDMQLALRVLDVSAEGCALLLPDDVPPVQPGVLVHHAVLDLDGDTRLEVTLQLQHVTLLSGNGHGVRLGCALHRLGGESQRALQRYIDQTQKKRRLLALD